MHRLHRERVVKPTRYMVSDGLTHRVYRGPDDTRKEKRWYYKACAPGFLHHEKPEIKEGDVTITCIACIASAL